MDLLIVGAGAMGQWVARTVPADVSVAFTDVDPAAARTAADATDARAVPIGDDGPVEAVCLAVPIPTLSAAAADHLPRAERAALDVTGVMGPAVDALATHAPDAERVSLHPLFAPANAPGNVAVVPDAPGPATDDLLAAIEAAGNRVFETTAEEHDRAMETVQSAAHAAVFAYALATESVRPAFHTPISSELADLVADVTDGEPRVYRDIQTAFPGAERVADAAARIADADGDGFERLYARAAASPFGAEAGADGRERAGDGTGAGLNEATGAGDGDGNDRHPDAETETEVESEGPDDAGGEST
jgi:prephenate dehydrogenase